MRALLTVSWWLLVPFTHAQPEPSIRLELGFSSGGPGETVSLPVNFSAVGDPQVATISYGISFPSKLISFVEANRGSAVESMEPKIKARLNTSNEEQSVLHIEVSVPSTLPQGEVLKLSFRISEEAPLNDEIVLENQRQEVLSVKGERLEVRGADGIILVATEPLFTCFFYMH